MIEWTKDMVLVGGDREDATRKMLEGVVAWLKSHEVFPRFTGVRRLAPLNKDAAATELLEHVATQYPGATTAERELAIRGAMRYLASPEDFKKSFERTVRGRGR